MMKTTWILCALASLGCVTTGRGTDDFTASIAAAHGEASLYDRPAVHARVDVTFGGQALLAARMTFEAASGRVRLDYDPGGVAVFDGTQAWARGFDDEELPMVRFHLLTWSYFLAAPWKLGDPGTHMGAIEEGALRGEPRDRARLTFGGGVGDTPDDWYVIYAEPDTHRLDALAYIVTFGTTVEQAEAEPHAATYEAWTELDGLELPTVLRFWNWSEAEGIVGESIGEARFANLRFSPAPQGTFDAPSDAVPIPVPR